MEVTIASTVIFSKHFVKICSRFSSTNKHEMAEDRYGEVHAIEPGLPQNPIDFSPRGYVSRSIP
jgi:hypothetical protein